MDTAVTTLRAVLRGGPLPVTEAVRLAVQLCDHLAAAHAQGRVHGDVRPEQVELTFGGVRARLVGFAPGGGGRPGLATAYAAPECRRGWSPPDVRADVYGVGAVLYETLVGRPPVGRLVWPGQADPAAAWLDPVLLRCLAERPDRRYRTVRQLRSALARQDGAVGGPGVTAIVVAAVLLGLGVIAVLVGLSRTVPPPVVATRVTPPVVVTPSTPVRTLTMPAPPDVSDALARLQQLRDGAGVPMVRRHTATPAWHPPTRVPTPSMMGRSSPPGMHQVQAGARGGGPFTKVDAGGRPVLGIEYTLGTWGGAGVLRQVDPIYDRADAPPPPGGRRQRQAVMARDGYAVGGLRVQYDDTNVLAFAVQFCRLRADGRLDPADQYVTDLVGYPDPGQTPQPLGDGSVPVVGLCGRQGLNLAAIGVVIPDANR